jgi:hypothetical protein
VEERDHVHGAPTHATAVLLGEDDLHVDRFHPVDSRIGGGLLADADVGVPADLGDVFRVQGAPERP